MEADFLAAPGGPWTSGLTVDGFTALRQVGFDPVGLVAGTTVQDFSWWSRHDGPEPARAYTTFFPLRSPDRRLHLDGMLYMPSLDRYVDGLTTAWQTARDRMVAECTDLRADGVVAVTTSAEPFQQNEDVIRFSIMGTAVRAQGAVHPWRPFASHLSAQDFAKLIAGGWVPVDLAVGISVFGRLNTPPLLLATRRRAPAQEINGWTELVSAAREHARVRLRHKVARVGATGVLLAQANLKVYQKASMRVAEAMFVGTAITDFGPSRNARPPLTITRL
jgi:uncharacterized protein YbjQ (UPF0145 family)